LENANPPHTLGLLRASHYWPRHSRPTKNTKKFPPPHIRPQGLGASIVSAHTSTLIGVEDGLAAAIRTLPHVQRRRALIPGGGCPYGP